MSHAGKIRRLMSSLSVAFGLTLVLCLPALAERILSFQSELRPEKDASMIVTETIRWDFGQSKRHGIYRFIPVKYERKKGVYSLDLKIASITNESGYPYKYTTGTDGRDLNIKIGDPNVTVSGVKTYKIVYLVRHAVNFFEGEPEIYWNVTGNEFRFPIAEASARIIPPPGIDPRQMRIISYVGPYGSTKQGPAKIEKDGAVFSAANLKGGDGLTVVARFPRGSITRPTFISDIRHFVTDWMPLVVIPTATAYFLFIYWWFQGKDKGGRMPVAVEFTPPKDLTPCEVGTLIDESCDLPDITATLVDLAARGHIRIRQLPYNGILMMSDKDYEFTRLNPPPGAEPLKLHETLFMDALFGFVSNQTLLSSMQGKFYPHIQEIKRAVWTTLLNNMYFTRHPESERFFFSLMGFWIGLTGAVIAVFGAFKNPELTSIGLGTLVSGVFIGLASGAMPCRTRKGAESLRDCLSFQRFVKKAEKERIRVLAKEDPTVFGRLLPYAMVLGCADQWANNFKEMVKEPPDWYQPLSKDGKFDGQLMDSTWFLHDLGRSLHTIQSGFNTPPVLDTYSGGRGGGSSGGWGGGGAGSGSSGFGGGGFSGGGFGGGGGGSW